VLAFKLAYHHSCMLKLCSISVRSHMHSDQTGAEIIQQLAHQELVMDILAGRIILLLHLVSVDPATTTTLLHFS
jgi:hypothetical protein